MTTNKAMMEILKEAKKEKMNIIKIEWLENRAKNEIDFIILTETEQMMHIRVLQNLSTKKYIVWRV